ncbi:MAG: HEAT repeat domain-containing protein [Pirellulales bacterium]|nr:HEAT repeat domain-containing protein [Pirellulales bacterium]
MKNLMRMLADGVLVTTCMWAITGCGESTTVDQKPERASSALLGSADDRTDDMLVTEALDNTAGIASASVVEVLNDRTTIDEDNPTRQHLRTVFRQSQSPPVRVAAIEGIAKGWDYDAMEDLFAALDDPSVEVRERAGKAVQRMIGLRFPYNASDPPAARAAVVAHMREKWEKLRDTGKLEQWLERLPEVQAKKTKRESRVDG